ncbi:MAG: ribosome biogenesis GTPase Der, partial [bacterium]|nr:ribosome biogenesis GTPase Der [bacterium]
LPDKENLIHQAVLTQVHQAIDEADVIVLLTDVTDGITALDAEVAKILQRTEKPILLAVNKVDNEDREMLLGEFYKLGLGDPIPISAISGRSTGDFLDRIVDLLPHSDVEYKEAEEPEMKIAVVGKPNVGKSSFVNAILGIDKMIVTEIPGTTRDSIDTMFKYYGRNYLLIDTAGLRKRSKVKESVEYFSTLRSISSIQRCDVAIILIDAVEGIGDQDKTIIQEAIRFKKGILLAVNKWDLIEKDTHTAVEFERRIQDEIPYLKYIPMLFISALTRLRVFKAIEIAQSIHEERSKKISTSDLNRFFEMTTQITTPAAVGGKEVKIKYCTQVKTKPPVFAFYCNHPKLIKPNYRMFLENKLREQFGFLGVPLTLVFRSK